MPTPDADEEWWTEPTPIQVFDLGATGYDATGAPTGHTVRLYSDRDIGDLEVTPGERLTLHNECRTRASWRRSRMSEGLMADQRDYAEEADVRAEMEGDAAELPYGGTVHNLRLDAAGAGEWAALLSRKLTAASRSAAGAGAIPVRTVEILSTAAMSCGWGLAVLLGWLEAKDPELARQAAAVVQDSLVNGGTPHCQDLMPGLPSAAAGYARVSGEWLVTGAEATATVARYPGA